MRVFGVLRAIAVVGVLVFLGCSNGNPIAGTPFVTVTSVAPKSGSTVGGTAVLVSGTNFENGATVQFGTAQAGYVGFNSSTSLSVSTPAGMAGSVTVTVTNPDGTSGALPAGFTYVAPACALPATITTNTTLTATCTWAAAQTVLVAGPSNPVLTIDPGTTVIFAAASGAPGASLQVGVGQPGTLVANGTSAAGITFTSAASSPTAGDWGGIVIGPQAAGSSIEYTSIEYAGGTGASAIPDPAALTVEGGDVAAGGGAGQTPAPVLSNLTITNSGGHGLVFAGLNSGFGTGSGNINVTGWEMTAHYPYVIEANAASTIPASIAATASAAAVVALNSYVNFSNEIVTSETLPSLPLPYLVVTNVEVGAAAGTSPATLTIASPNTIEFLASTQLDVDPSAAGAGYLVANGSGANSLVFKAAPDAGTWSGLNFSVGSQSQGQSPSSLTNCLVEFANGGPNGPPAYGTGSITVANDTGFGALAGPTISGCQILDYPSYGITLFQIQSSNYSAYMGSNTFGIPTTVTVTLPDGGVVHSGPVSSSCFGVGGCTDTF